MHKITQLTLATAGLALCLPLAAGAQSLTNAGWGGNSQAVDREAFFGPFTAATGIEIIDDTWQGDMATIVSQVDTETYRWSFIRGDTAQVVRGCEDGILEPLDWERLGKPDDFLPGAWNECGYAFTTWSRSLAYNAEDWAEGEEPKTVAAFFDLENYPGKRASRRDPQYLFEIALLADGVPVGEIYDVLRTEDGIDRVFAKLDTIKDELIWWEAGSQPPQLLADREVVISTAFSNRIVAAADEGQPLEVLYNGLMLDYDWYFIPKGSPDFESTMQFLEFIDQPEVAAVPSNLAPFGPVLISSFEFVTPEAMENLPTAPQNTEDAFSADFRFWADYNEELTVRLENWLQQ